MRACATGARLSASAQQPQLSHGLRHAQLAQRRRTQPAQRARAAEPETAEPEAAVTASAAVTAAAAATNAAAADTNPATASSWELRCVLVEQQGERLDPAHGDAEGELWRSLALSFVTRLRPLRCLRCLRRLRRLRCLRRLLLCAAREDGRRRRGTRWRR